MATEEILPNIDNNSKMIPDDFQEGNLEFHFLVSFVDFIGNIKDLDNFEKSSCRKLLKALVTISHKIIPLRGNNNYVQLFKHEDISCKPIGRYSNVKEYKYLFLKLSKDEIVYEFDKIGDGERVFFFISRDDSANIIHILDIRHHPDRH